MKATILFDEPLLHIESRKFSRSSIKMKKGQAIIEAKDAVAFRAACDSLLRQLIIAEKARKVVNKGLRLK